MLEEGDLGLARVETGTEGRLAEELHELFAHFSHIKDSPILPILKSVNDDERHRLQVNRPLLLPAQLEDAGGRPDGHGRTVGGEEGLLLGQFYVFGKEFGDAEAGAELGEKFEEIDASDGGGGEDQDGRFEAVELTPIRDLFHQEPLKLTDVSVDTAALGKGRVGQDDVLQLQVGDGGIGLLQVLPEEGGELWGGEGGNVARLKDGFFCLFHCGRLFHRPLLPLNTNNNNIFPIDYLLVVVVAATEIRFQEFHLIIPKN